MPRRQKVKLRKPKFVSRDATANHYWNKVLRDLEGIDLLDNLDSETFAGYCNMLARRDALIALEQGEGADGGDEVGACDTKLLQTLNKDILAYADKLGLTPSGRVRLAQKRSAAIADDLERTEERDLFGD